MKIWGVFADGDSVSKDGLTVKLLSLFFVSGFLIGLQLYNRRGARTRHRGASDVPWGLSSVVWAFVGVITALLLFVSCRIDTFPVLEGAPPTGLANGVYHFHLLTTPH